MIKYLLLFLPTFSHGATLRNLQPGSYFFIVWLRIVWSMIVLLIVGGAINSLFEKTGVYVYGALLVCWIFAAIASQDELAAYFKAQRAETPVQRETENAQ